VPGFCDYEVTPDGAGRPAKDAAPVRETGGDPRDEAIALLEELPPDERWRFWLDEFHRCIRCYACRAACPLCYCETCIADKHRPQWISTAIENEGNTAWNLVRAFHLTGRCTGCDECARVCPSQIRLDLINRRMAQEVERLFGYRAGEDPEAPPPLTVFRDDDPEGFIL
jgi:ferredoxin